MNGQQPYDLRERTTNFALQIVRFYMTLPKSAEAQILGKQVLRSGTSVGAHYRECTRSRSLAEFVSKMEGGLQELEETDYWLELLLKAGIVNHEAVQSLISETKALTAIFITSVRTAKSKKPK
jgi:four helix bundle protein